MTSDDARLRVLVVDDDLAIREALSRTLERFGHEVVLAEDGQAGLDRLREGEVHILLVDLQMPRLSGQELLKAAKAIAPDVEVIVITGHGTVEDAVDAMKEGAYDFITKPFKRVQLERTIRRAAEKQSLALQNRRLQERLDEIQGAEKIIGSSPLILRTLDLVRQVGFDQAYAFKYSPRHDTPAVTLPDQVPLPVREERHARLFRLINEVGAERYSRYVGRRVEVLVEGPSRKNPADYPPARLRPGWLRSW